MYTGFFYNSISLKTTAESILFTGAGGRSPACGMEFKY